MSEQSGHVDLSVCQVGDVGFLADGSSKPFEGTTPKHFDTWDSHPYFFGGNSFRRDGMCMFEPGPYDIVRVTRNGEQITPPVSVMKDKATPESAGQHNDYVLDGDAIDALSEIGNKYADTIEAKAVAIAAKEGSYHKGTTMPLLLTRHVHLAAQPAATGEGEELERIKAELARFIDRARKGCFNLSLGDIHELEWILDPKWQPSAPPSPPAEVELLDRIGSVTGEHPLPTTTLDLPPKEFASPPSPPQRVLQLWEEPKPIVLEDPVDMAAAMPGDACLRRDGKWVDFECTKPEREFCHYVAGGLRYTRTGGHWRDTISDKDIIRIVLRPRVAQVNAAGGKAVNNV